MSRNFQAPEETGIKSEKMMFGAVKGTDLQIYSPETEQKHRQTEFTSNQTTNRAVEKYFPL